MRALIYELNDILVHQCTFLYIGICHIFILKNLNPQETGAHPIKMVYFDIFSVYLYVIYV